MLISLKWLSDYVDCPLSPERIADGLTMAGLEVESLSLRYPQLKNVMTARIEAVEPHPNADRLNICVVIRPGRSAKDRLRRSERARRSSCSARPARGGATGRVCPGS